MIGQVAFRLIFGMALSWCLSPRKEITSGFFRLQMLITLALSVLAALTFITDASHSRLTYLAPFLLSIVGGAMAVVAYADSILWMLERRAAASRGLWILLGISAIAVCGSSSALNIEPASVRWLNLLSELSSGWLMGGILMTMLLGHWYLTATGMKLQPLVQMNRWVGVAAISRALLAIISLCLIGTTRLSSTDWVWLCLRWAGLIGPLVMAVLVMRILRYRNTQAATGVLYASTILVFMGETAALLLARSQDFGSWL